MKLSQFVLFVIIVIPITGFLPWNRELHPAQPEQEPLSITQVNPERPSVPKLANDQTYTPHAPIWIHGDEDLRNSFPGSGTESDPIRIEGFNITTASGDLISIGDTTYYFRIANNFLNGLTMSGDGITLHNVVNGTISNNLIFGNNHNGIFLYNSSKISIANNVVHNSGFAEINLANSRHNTISGNTVFNNFAAAGIYVVEDNYDNIISNNTLFGNDVGIRFEFAAVRNRIAENNLTSNNFAIWLEYAWNNTIEFNRVRNNFVGIDIVDGDHHGISLYNVISRNLLFENYEYGLRLQQLSEHNLIVRNNFVDNSLYGGPQAYDDGWNNTFVYNYWSEWTEPDDDLDGFVDLPYQIGGSTNNQDHFCWTSPTSGITYTSLDHVIMTILLLVLILGALGGSIFLHQRK
jgi:parallel beta-helix repeat protein